MDENDNYSSSSNPPKNQIYEPNLPPTGLSRSRKMSRADSENVLKELAAFVKDDDEDRLIKSFDDSTKLTVKVYDHDGNIGVIKVKNIAFEKSVIIRYTTDRWKSYTDFPAIYIQGTCDGFYDKFSFFLEFYNETTDFVELAIKYSVCNIDYWDNNDRRNYCFEYQDIVKSRTKLLFAWFDDAWLHFR